jgi:hypothetical protein
MQELRLDAIGLGSIGRQKHDPVHQTRTGNDSSPGSFLRAADCVAIAQDQFDTVEDR